MSRGFLLASRCCGECLLTGRMVVSSARQRELLQACVRQDRHFQCHRGTIAGVDLCCRGFFERFPGVGQLRRIAQRLGVITEVDPEELSMPEKKRKGGPGRRPKIDRKEAKRLEEKEGLSRAAIGKRLGCCSSSLTRILGPLEGRKRPTAREPVPDEARRQEIMKLLREGKRKRVILAQLRCRYGLIQSCVEELQATGWAYEPQGFGEDHALAMEQRNGEIWERRGEGVEALAVAFDLSERTIRHVLKQMREHQEEASDATT